MRTYTLVPYNNSNAGYTISVTLPRPCGVRLQDGTKTYDLRLKDVVQANWNDYGYDAKAWGNGFMMALKTNNLASLDLDGHPKYRDRLTSLIDTKQLVGNPFLPVVGTAAEKGSWINGFLSADGWPGKFVTSNEEHINFFLENHVYAGLVQTGNVNTNRKFIRVNRSVSFYTEHSVTYAKGIEFKGYRVLVIAERQDEQGSRDKDKPDHDHTSRRPLPVLIVD